MRSQSSASLNAVRRQVVRRPADSRPDALEVISGAKVRLLLISCRTLGYRSGASSSRAPMVWRKSISDSQFFFAQPPKQAPTKSRWRCRNGKEPTGKPCFRVRSVSKSRAIACFIRQNAAERALYLVQSGVLEVTSVAGGGSVRAMDWYRPGSVVGELSFLDGKPRSAEVYAILDGVLYRLDFRAYQAFADAHPRKARDLVLAIGRVVALRLRRKLSHVKP